MTRKQFVGTGVAAATAAGLSMCLTATAGASRRSGRFALLCKGKTVLAAALMLVPLVPLAAAADDYQFIVSGYPAANTSYPKESAATSLETSTRARPTAADALEARYRTRDKSGGIALRSDKPTAFYLIVR